MLQAGPLHRGCQGLAGGRGRHRDQLPQGFGRVAGVIGPQPAGDGARGGGGRREEGQPGAQRVPLPLLQPVAPDPGRLPEVGAAVRQHRLPGGAQMVLELLKFGRRRALQLYVVQPIQDEGRVFVLGREQGVECILGLVEVAQRLGSCGGRKGGTHNR